MQNATGKGTLAAPLYEENLHQWYPQVQFVNNQMPINSNLSEPPGDDPFVVCPLGIVPLNFEDTVHGKGLITSSTFSNSKIIGNAPNTSSNGNAPNKNGNHPLPQPVKLCSSKKTSIVRKNEKLEKTT